MSELRCRQYHPNKEVFIRYDQAEKQDIFLCTNRELDRECESICLEYSNCCNFCRNRTRYEFNNNKISF
ncbi:MAG: hypothetical protein QT05_C0051G0061 [archaeon GW2011_AR13]|nr:MAG: hypothetical protein QT05_C0051G0061 [archaeon GW2011_AR13]HIG94393.1 hypothetical protein [Nanoarchaeota archaeon]HIH63637.1 hypothetical protein [Nanoarchaeota archaeon]HIJ10108.1 hypothetical protein [Nanoarchaeota archaeon]